MVSIETLEKVPTFAHYQNLHELKVKFQFSAIANNEKCSTIWQQVLYALNQLPTVKDLTIETNRRNNPPAVIPKYRVAEEWKSIFDSIETLN